jgi:hypothetical protein
MKLAGLYSYGILYPRQAVPGRIINGRKPGISDRMVSGAAKAVCFTHSVQGCMVRLQLRKFIGAA